MSIREHISRNASEAVKKLGFDITSDIASIPARAYQSKLQVIQRGKKNRQFYLICPAPLAAALELEKGETLDWVVLDRHTLEIRRQKSTRHCQRSSHE
jgi:hypothetical protein